jgi:hypothetical protein
VLALGHESEIGLAKELEALDMDIPIQLAGDCLSPRSAGEAVYVGMLAGRAV